MKVRNLVKLLLDYPLNAEVEIRVWLHPNRKPGPGVHAPAGEIEDMNGQTIIISGSQRKEG